MSSTCLVVMGVSGAGKSTVAQLLAHHLQWPSAEADDFHPEANIDRMTAGLPLTDDDRMPWLRSIRDWSARHSADGTSTIVTCSALKRTYRDVLRQSRASVRFVHLSGTAETIGGRLTSRSGHFMPSSLLHSQFDDLEPLEPDEDGTTVDTANPPEDLVRQTLAALDLNTCPAVR
ncbi:gluconokinase [Saccharopolyspora lacisalsi]|uniref:Gluconokinase n=1 Tax=Halosaccharopolyspora lacisalsi TaxID=1000566 RepID=A0A839DXX3_9PSEU|nr:gluconokinase [Halosaccharopolyspora lacisalsi]MBA8824215.1 gluconokinase [Halosaccharopolyspora lacisalsi]